MGWQESLARAEYSVWQKPYTPPRFLARIGASYVLFKNAPFYGCIPMSYKMPKAPFLILAACVAACAPNSMPKGYVYHGAEYKSPNPPESTKFTDEQRVTMGPEQADQFRLSVYQLVESLTRRAGMPPKNIFVLKPERMTPFYANMDNDLRESMRHMGYTLSDTPDNAYAFAYTAYVLKDGDMAQALPSGQKPNVRLTLHVFDKAGDGAKLLTEETGDFFIQGAEKLDVPFASFPGKTIPEPTGPGTFRE